MSRKTRKLMWSVPLIAAVAVIGALALFVTLTPNDASADHVDLPGIVTDVKAEAVGRNEVKVTWRAPATGGTPDHYRIDRSENGDVWMRLVQMHTGMDLSISDTNDVKPGEAYHYRVFAVNLAGTSPSSDLTEDTLAMTDVSERPGPVRMLTAKAAGPNRIDLSWDPPEDDGGADITRYCISTAGSDGTAETPGVLPVPGTNATEFSDSANNPCLYNTPPTDDDRLTAIRDPNGAGVIVIRAPEGAGKVVYMHEELLAANEWRYEVYAVNERGFSATATAVAPTPKTGAAGKPSRPGLRVVASSVTSVDLFWTWPADNGGTAITTFIVEAQPSAGTFTAVTSSPVAVTPTDPATPNNAELGSQAITGTTAFRVRANNGTKMSDWSNTVTVQVTTTGGVSTLTNPAPALVAGLSASDDTSLRQVDLKWTDVANTSFLVDVSTDQGRIWKALQGNTGITDATYNHRGLEPDTNDQNDDDYTYRVFSYRNGAYGPIVVNSDNAVVTGSTSQAMKPAAVRGLKTSSDDPTKILLEWVKPTVDGGEPITGYRVEIGLDNEWPTGTSATAITHPRDDCVPLEATNICARGIDNAGTTMFVLDGLNAGNVRWFRVFAINKVAEADTTGDAVFNFPDADDVRTALPKDGKSAASGRPGVPLDLTVQPARDANEDDPSKLGIDILWNTPGNPAGGTVTGYVISRRVKESSTASWGAWDDDWMEIIPPDAFLRTHITDTDEPEDLADGEMREYRVAAKSGRATSSWTSAVVYPVDTSHAAVETDAVGPATSVTTGPFNEGGVIQVNWDAAPNAAGYIIYAVNVDELGDPDGQIVVAPVNDAAAETFNLGGLNSGDTYDIYVVATAKEMAAWPADAGVVQVEAE